MYKEDLFDDLHKYGNLKLAIKKLEDREEDLRNIKKTQDKTTKKTPNNMFKSKKKESVK